MDRIPTGNGYLGPIEYILEDNPVPTGASPDFIDKLYKEILIPKLGVGHYVIGETTKYPEVRDPRCPKLPVPGEMVTTGLFTKSDPVIIGRHQMVGYVCTVTGQEWYRITPPAASSYYHTGCWVG